MTATVTLEIDTSPDLYLSSREFTGQLVDAQLFRPLFRIIDDEPVGDLLEVVNRPSGHTWSCRVRGGAKWQDGQRIVAAEVAERLRRVTTGPRGGWLSSLLERVEMRNERELSITTRIPIARLEQVLAMPLLAPRRRDSYSGAYRLAEVTATQATLAPFDSSTPYVRLVTTPTREDGRRRYLSGELDVGWGIGVPTEFWSAADEGPFDSTKPLDMHVVVVAGRTVPAHVADEQLRGLRLEAGSVPGISATNSRFSSSSDELDDAPRLPRSLPRPLYYTPFPPNRRIANEIAERTQGRLRPTEITYEEMLSSSHPNDGFSLQIHAGAFPGALGLMPETIYIARGLLGNRRELQDLACQAWASFTDNEASTACAALERDLDRLIRRRVVGRVLTRFRSEAPIRISRNGLFDFAQLTERKDAM